MMPRPFAAIYAEGASYSNPRAGTPATGRTVTLPGASFTHVEGDKIHSEQIYFDRQNLYEQLGLKPK
jgi:predicted ester cyclase